MTPSWIALTELLKLQKKRSVSLWASKNKSLINSLCNLPVDYFYISLLKIYLERTQLLLHFTPFQKEELVFFPISRISVYRVLFALSLPSTQNTLVTGRCGGNKFLKWCLVQTILGKSPKIWISSARQGIHGGHPRRAGIHADLQGILAELKITLQVQRSTGIDELKGVLQVKISRASTPSSRLFYRWRGRRASTPRPTLFYRSRSRGHRPAQLYSTGEDLEWASSPTSRLFYRWRSPGHPRRGHRPCSAGQELRGHRGHHPRPQACSAGQAARGYPHRGHRPCSGGQELQEHHPRPQACSAGQAKRGHPRRGHRPCSAGQELQIGSRVWSPRGGASPLEFYYLTYLLWFIQ